MSGKCLGDLDVYVRSKNAGPFWITIDLFCGSADIYRAIVDSKVINAALVAERYGTKPDLVKIFESADLNVIKVSFPRSTPQGHARDRDQHSGQCFVRLLDLPVPYQPAA